MIRLLISRLLQIPLALLAVYTITLILAWAVPGNPLEGPEGRRPPPEVVAAMQARYRLDSFGGFYLSYLADASGFTAATRPAQPASTGVTQPFFDLGPSLQYPDRTVNEIIASALPVSMLIGLAAVAFGLTLGIVAGTLGALRPGSFLDAGTFIVALAGISIPTFVTGTLLQWVFTVQWGLFPVAEWGHPRDLVLPAFTLGLPTAAYIARLVRIGMIEQLASDHVRTARAKGLSEFQVITRHALRNALLPVISFLGPALAMAMTGSFVVERLFVVPGLGQHFVNAVQNKDLFLIIGVVLVYATLLMLMNLVVDLLYRWADPRITAS